MTEKTGIELMHQALPQVTRLDALLRKYDTTIYGYHTKPEGDPDYNPPLTVPCPGCGRPVGSEGIQTVSFMVPGTARSWFYRGHKACLTEEVTQRTEGAIVDAITNGLNAH